MTRRRWSGAIATAAAMLLAPIPAAAQVGAAREPTDVMIRRLAGLPAASARGEIEILDVGHHAMETMVSIVAHRGGGGWSVSYACAESPACAPGSDHAARTYDLSPANGAEVDRLVAELKTGVEPDGQRPTPSIIGGWLRVTITEGRRQWQFARVAMWGKTLGRLERLLTPPAP